MKHSTHTPIEVVPASEVARAAGCAPATMRRRLQSAGIEPAAILTAGSLRPPVPLFSKAAVADFLAALPRHNAGPSPVAA